MKFLVHLEIIKTPAQFLTNIYKLSQVNIRKFGMCGVSQKNSEIIIHYVIKLYYVFEIAEIVEKNLCKKSYS